ncbi:carbohydrate porin [Lutimonas saemankumensis]|uniref:carbohydrate porin n=1 Tax=Lutimonas saemankumensis TaxID=483016 RepID=UPI001CD2545C|nr:carbohydrate porin [Lutimonas saemankumensis]MCA0933591.1 carbohydrate porin [Lutimonas saemankumensis]
MFSKPALLSKEKPCLGLLKLFCVFFIGFSFPSSAQIQYQISTNKNVSIGSYGRAGVDWSFENGGSIGRRLNLNNMGSIGGRLEEQDYLEVAPNFNFSPKEGDETIIYAQIRLSVYTTGVASFANSTSSSIGGLGFSMPEIFVEARNIKGSDVSIWAGSRLYRGPDVHIADHFYFNDHSGAGFGVEFKKTRLSTVFVASTDTTSTLPPYFYLNIKTGTPSAELRQRVVMVAEQDIDINENNAITLLGEFHRMADADGDVENDSIAEIYNFPSDYGFVIGAKHQHIIKKLKSGSFNDFSLRYGTGIANGGDGGLSKTWLTYGAPDTIARNFQGAYSLALVNHTVLNFSDRYSLNGYVIFANSKGAADTNGLSKTYFGREVYNRKIDFTVGVRNQHYLSDYFHLLTEVNYSQRKDGENPWASMLKFSVAPVYVPTGQRDVWARPHIRFVASAARYNDFAMESLYSPYLEATGPKRWGYYFGVKVEWWIWN